MKQLIIFGVFIGFMACTPPSEKDKAVARLRAKIVELEKLNTDIDAKIKEIENDAGQKIRFEHDKELLKSRLERIKEQVQVLTGKKVEKTTDPPSGH